MMSMMKLLPWLMLSWCFAFIMFSNVALVAGDDGASECNMFLSTIQVTEGNLVLQPADVSPEPCHGSGELCVMYVCSKEHGEYSYGVGCRTTFQLGCKLNDEEKKVVEEEVAGTCSMIGNGIYHVCEGKDCGLQFNECVRSKLAEDPPLSIGNEITLDKIQLDSGLDPTTPIPTTTTLAPEPEPEKETPPPAPETTTTPTPMPTTTDVPTTTSTAKPTTKAQTTSSTEKKKPMPKPAEPTTTTSGAKENFTILKLSAAIIFCAFGLAFL